MADPTQPSQPSQPAGPSGRVSSMSVLSDEDVINIGKYVQQSALQVELARDLNAELKDILDIRTKINSGDKAALYLFREMTSSAGENVEFLRKTEKLHNSINKDLKTSLGLEREMAAIQLKNFDTAKQAVKKGKELEEAIRNCKNFTFTNFIYHFANF